METEALKQKSLAGRTALVTGASRGIGRAIAVTLVKEGAFTYINYEKNEGAAQETLGIIEKERGKGTLLPFDVRNADAVKKAITEIAAQQGSLDILVNNAGITLDGIFARTREENWNDVIDINLRGVFNCSKSALRHMMRKRWGRIINMTSVVAEAGNAGQVCYSASKAGIIGLTKSLAKEIGSRNICVNAVAPGFVETDMTASIKENNREKLVDLIPLARLGSPDDIAGVVAFLASGGAGYITGQVIHVNGGLYM